MKTANHKKEGSCTCGRVRYQLTEEPMIVHACHCRGCQKNSGTAFAINALYEADRVTLVSGKVETVSVPTPSGTGQDITRCVQCKVAVWSNYDMGGLRSHIRFVRVGTLDNPDQLPPDVHIYTGSKQPWVILPEEDPRVDMYYKRNEIWPAESIDRLTKLKHAAGLAHS